MNLDDKKCTQTVSNKFLIHNFTRSERISFPSHKIRPGPYLDNPYLDLHFDDEDI